MSYPILYAPTEVNFHNNGFGILSDCISCLVSEVGNGKYELEMKYPMDGIHFEDIADRSIIKAKPNQHSNPQLFRIYGKSKPISGIVTFSAAHISYDLSGIPISPFYAENVQDALSGFSAFAAVSCPFSFWTDKTTEAVFYVGVPSSIRSKLGGSSGSILDVYGGEYEFDNYTVKLHKNRGANRGVSIRYGKNLTNIKQDENCSNVYTGVYPYWVDAESEDVFTLTEKIVYTDGEYDFEKILTLDMSTSFEKKPTENQLRSATEEYIRSNNIGVPDVSLKVSFSQLGQNEETLEKIYLFDTVNVEFPALKVSSSAKAVQIVYDVLLDRVKSVTLGSVRSNIADTVASQQKDIASVPTQADLYKVQSAATAWLTSGKGYKVERRDEYGMVVDTLYLDKPDIDSAVNVMKVGKDGIGFSSDGVNGTFYTAFSIQGFLQSHDGSVKFDLKNNESFIGKLNGKILSWLENEDGTFTLIGT